MPSNKTARIGPILEIATKPKLSSEAFLSLRTDANPTPKAKMKGTVIGPVVAPPESKATGTKSFGVRKESKITNKYSTISKRDKLILNKIRKTAMVKQIPTPIATVQTSKLLGIAGI